MPKNRNVLMNVEGVDFYINDDNYKHFQSLSNFEQEVKKKILFMSVITFITIFLNVLINIILINFRF